MFDRRASGLAGASARQNPTCWRGLAPLPASRSSSAFCFSARVMINQPNWTLSLPLCPGPPLESQNSRKPLASAQRRASGPPQQVKDHQSGGPLTWRTSRPGRRLRAGWPGCCSSRTGTGAQSRCPRVPLCPLNNMAQPPAEPLRGVSPLPVSPSCPCLADALLDVSKKPHTRSGLTITDHIISRTVTSRRIPQVSPRSIPRHY